MTGPWARGWRSPVEGGSPERIVPKAMGIWCRWKIRRDLDLRIEGLHNLPRTGPGVIVCRHYHHIYDGCILIGALGRPVRIVVALDWVGSAGLRALMEALCHLAGWPIVLRRERLVGSAGQALGGSAYDAREIRPYLKRALADARDALRAGGMLAVFPEGYPTVDPVFTPKVEDNVFLPFRSGFVRIAELAQRDGRTCVAIIPAGLHYQHGERRQVTLRFGSPLYLDAHTNRIALVRTVEEQVRTLSSAT